MTPISKGFSLIEILIALSLLAIIASIAVPNMQTLNTTTTNKTTLQNVLSLIETTQIAVKNAHTSAGITQSGQQLTAFFDVNNNGSITNDSQLIGSITLPKQTNLHWRTFPSYRSYIHVAQEYTDNGTIWLCNKDKLAWAIAMNKQGRINQIDNPSVSC